MEADVVELVGRSAPIGVCQLNTISLDLRIWLRIIKNSLSDILHSRYKQLHRMPGVYWFQHQSKLTLILRSLARELEWVRDVACKGGGRLAAHWLRAQDRQASLYLHEMSTAPRQNKDNAMSPHSKGTHNPAYWRSMPYLIASRRPGQRESKPSQALHILRKGC